MKMAMFQTIEEARAFFDGDRYAMENGIRLEEYLPDGSVCTMELTAHHHNAEGGVMGGAILALADFTFAVASVNAHRPTVAQQVSLSFLNASKGTRLISTATCIKSGRSSCVYRIDIKDDLGKDIAQAMFTGFKL